MNSTRSRLLCFEVFLGILGVAPPLIAAISSLDPSLWDQDHSGFTVLCFVTAGLIAILCVFPFRMFYVRDETVLDRWKRWWMMYSILTAIFGIAVVIVCFASFGSDDEEESVFGYMSSGVIGGTLACLGFTLFYPCVLACVLPAVTTQVEDNHPVQMVRADSNKDNVVPAKLVVEGQIKEVSFGQEAA
jgi:hypothetical protein